MTELEASLFTVYIYVDQAHSIQCWSEDEEEFPEETGIYYLGKVQATVIEKEIRPDLLQRLLLAQSNFDELPNIGEFGYLQDKRLVGIVR